MNFSEISTPYEKKKMFLYKSNVNGITSRFVEVRHVENAFYIGKPERQEGRSYDIYDLYFYLTDRGTGICVGWTHTDAEVREVCDWHSCLGSGAVSEFIAYLDRCAQTSIFIPKNMLALAAEVKAENMDRYTASNAEILRRREEQRAADRAAREQEDAAYVAAKNNEAQAAIDAAVSILQNDGVLRNTQIEIYRSRYDSSVYSLVNHLMRQYGIKAPLRTQGWINEKLVWAAIEDGVCEQVKYRASKNRKCSDAVFGCLTELAQAARKEARV